jgi:TPR repeat protein
MIGGACHLGIGIEADRVEAAHWLIRSAEQGNELADAYLRRYVLPELAEKELAQALARAREPLG